MIIINKIGKVMLTSAAVATLLSPGIMNGMKNVSASSNSVSTTRSQLRTMRSAIPNPKNGYWEHWRHVKLQQPITISVDQHYKNNMGGWDTRTLKTYQMPKGRSIYLLGGNFSKFRVSIKNPNVQTNQTKKLKQNKEVLHTYLKKQMPKIQLVDDKKFNVAAKKLNLRHSKYNNISNKYWREAYYSYNGSDKKVRLFPNLKSLKHLINVQMKEGDIGDSDMAEDNDPKENKYIEQVNKEHKKALKPSINYSNKNGKVLVKLTKHKQYVKINLHNHIYYADLQDMFNPYNTETTSTVQSDFAPTKSNLKHILVKKGQNIYVYKGAEWNTNTKTYHYNGKKWILDK